MSIAPRSALKCAVLGLALAGAASAREIKLKDGTSLQGEILGREDSLVIIRSDALGEIKVEAAKLAEEPALDPAASPARPGAAQEPVRTGRVGEPSDQALF